MFHVILIAAFVFCAFKAIENIGSVILFFLCLWGVVELISCMQ